MKRLLGLGLLVVSASATASYTVCSSPSLYFSQTRVDSGIPPRPGMVTGTITIVSKGSVLVRQNVVEGTPTRTRYRVSFDGTPKVLDETGVGTASGARVFRVTGVLKAQRAPAEVEMLRTPLVCEETWALVP